MATRYPALRKLVGMKTTDKYEKALKELILTYVAIGDDAGAKPWRKELRRYRAARQVGVMEFTVEKEFKAQMLLTKRKFALLLAPIVMAAKAKKAAGR